MLARTCVLALALLGAVVPALGAPGGKRATFDISPARADAVARALVGGLGSIASAPAPARVARSVEDPSDVNADVDELADELAALQQVPQAAVGRALGARLERLNRRHLDADARVYAEREIAAALVA